jgi:hypothetical protein
MHRAFRAWAMSRLHEVDSIIGQPPAALPLDTMCIVNSSRSHESPASRYVQQGARTACDRQLPHADQSGDHLQIIFHPVLQLAQQRVFLMYSLLDRLTVHISWGVTSKERDKLRTYSAVVVLDQIRVDVDDRWASLRALQPKDSTKSVS